MGVEHREARSRVDLAPTIARIVAIINPVSGAGLDPQAAEKRSAFIRDVLRRAGHDVAPSVTERAGHARELATAAAASGADLVIVWGGDGTVNEVGAALAGTSTALGLVPAGSGNGLAAALTCPRDAGTALARILSSPPRPVDVGVLAGRPFLNIAGIGFDAHIASLFNERGRGRRGKLPYIVIGVREGCRYRGRDYEIDLDGEKMAVRALLIAFANGREYGMGACISPSAELDDGLLEATVVEDRAVVARFLHARHLALGSVHRAPRTLTRQIRRATVRARGPIAFHVDGEPGMATDVIEVRVERHALLVRG